MAQVATRSQERVDVLLDSLIDAWRELPAVARKIDRWDLIAQIDYVEEWGAKESLADVLRGMIASPTATAEQRARYGELQRLTREYSPILNHLRSG